MKTKELNSEDKVWTSASSNLEEARDILIQAIQQKRLVTILGSCIVEYQGRARSLLSEGERLIILKRDGTILVHQDSKVEPINWQPPGATLKVTLEDSKLCIYANRAKPRETVRIAFSSILLLSASSLRDVGQFDMYLTEVEMQEVLSANPELIEPGLRTIKRERRVPPGFIDIFARDALDHLVIVEIKRRRADREAVLQLHNYLKSLQSPKENEAQIRGILVAPSLTKGTHALLDQLGLEYRKINPQQLHQYIRHLTSHRLTDFVE